MPIEDIEHFTMDQLLDEVAKRAAHCVIYVEQESRHTELFIRVAGDPIKMYGAAQLRIIPAVLEYAHYMARRARDADPDQP